MFEESSASSTPSSLWSSMNNWLTPTLLFLILNIIIATIALTSKLANQTTNPHNQTHHQITSLPSVIQRLKSINLHTLYKSQEPQNSSHQHKPNPDSDTLFNPEQTHQPQFLQTQAHYFFQEFFPEQTHEANPLKTQTHFVFEQKDSIFNDFEQKDSNFNDFEQPHDDKVDENELQSMDEVYSQLTGGHFSRTKSDSGEIPAKLPAKMKKFASLKSSFGHFAEEDIVEARRPATVRERGNAKVTDGDEEVDAKADDFINRFKQQLKLQKLDSIDKYKDMNRYGERKVNVNF